MPRKVKQKQKQKQKQSQTVIVNIGKEKRRRQTRQKKQPPPPPPSPSFIPYPVPNLRGPDQIVSPQPTLIQMLEALRPIQAPVAPVAPVIPPIVIPPVDEGKEEAGPMRMVAPVDALILPEGPLISKRPLSPQYSASASSSSSSYPADYEPPQISSSLEMPEQPGGYTPRFLNNLTINRGELNLRGIAGRMGIELPRGIKKAGIIQAILDHNPNTRIPRQKIPYPKIAKQE